MQIKEKPNLICGKMIYCWDIDGTICTQETDYNLAKPFPEIIKQINNLYSNGHIIIFHTARGYVTGINWEEITKKQLSDWGIKYHKLIFGKPNADYYVDEKSIRPGEIDEEKKKE